MPSMPLSVDRKARVHLLTGVSARAIDVIKGRLEQPQAVAALVMIVPPCRIDIVDEVSYNVGKATEQGPPYWPPLETRYELVYRVKRVVLGERELVGHEGVRVLSTEYTDTMQTRRRVFRLTRHGKHVLDAKSAQELAKHIDLASLKEAEQDVQPGPTDVARD